MKKGLFTTILLFALMLMGSAFAEKEVTVSLRVDANPNGAIGADVAFSYDKDVLEFVSASGENGWSKPENATGAFSFVPGANPIPVGTIGTITFRIKDGAKAGPTKVDAILEVAGDINASSVPLMVSGGSVTVEAPTPVDPGLGDDPTECKHKNTSEKITKAPTCTEPGEAEDVCDDCGEVVNKSKPVPAKGHTPGEWEVVTQPKAGAPGKMQKKCKDCGTVLEEKEFNCEHKNTSEKVTKAPTCTEAGEKQTICKDCDASVKTEVIPAKGHTPGEWEIVTEATAGAPGKMQKKCVDCGTALEEKEYTCEHKHTEEKVTKQPTCTEAGEKQIVCKDCGAVVKTEAVPALGHKTGAAVVVKRPTAKETGLQQWKCTRCGAVVKEEVLPIVTTDWRYNQSVCSMGLRYRDVKPGMTRKWYMFTPLDLSKDGTSTYPLIAANIHIVGKATVTVANGKVKVTYQMANCLKARDMGFAIVPSLNSVSNPDELNFKAYAFGQEISIADDLGGDTRVLLQILGHMDYDANGDLELFSVKNKTNAAALQAMKDLMD